MDCERFDQNCMGLLYAELDELTEAASLRHLHHCTRCRTLWGHLRTTREMSQLPQEEPPDDLLDQILEAERLAQGSLPVRERFSRTVSVLAGYAMRPQLAMAVLLALVIGSSLIFVRAQPNGNSSDGMKVVERGVPSSDTKPAAASHKALVFGGEPEGRVLSHDVDVEESTDDEIDISKHRSTQSEESRSRERAAYAEAMTAYQQGRYAEAERLFSEVASAGGEQATSAALHEGHAARNGSGCQRAASIYDAVASGKKGGTVSAEASWHAAACYRAMGQIERAIAHYRKLASSGAFAARAKEALAELAPPKPPTLPVADTTSPTTVAQTTPPSVPSELEKNSPSAETTTQVESESKTSSGPARDQTEPVTLKTVESP